MTDEPIGFEIQAQWILDPMSVPASVNQMLIQNGPPLNTDSFMDGVYLTFGHLNPPMIAGPPTEETQAQMAASIFPVVPVSRFVVSRERLDEFQKTIAAFLESLPK